MDLLFLLVLITATTSVKGLQVDSTPNATELVMTEVFRYEYWNIDRLDWTWDAMETVDFVYYDYNQKTVLQNFTYYGNIDSEDEQGVLQLSAKFTRNKSEVSGIDSGKEFMFRYGEFEWRAKISPSRSVLNIFRIGQLFYQQDESEASEDKPAVQLAVQRWNTTHTSLRADVFFRQKQNSSIGFPLSRSHLFPIDLSNAFNNYKLKWSETEMIWFVNNIEIHRTKDALNIPQEQLPIVIYLAAGKDFTGVDESTLLIESVIVRQHQIFAPIPQPSHFNYVIKNNFLEQKSLDRTLWQVEKGAIPYSGAGNSDALYVGEAVRIRDGVLQFRTGQLMNRRLNKTYCVAGGIHAEKRISFLYGEIEWKMKAHPISGVKYELSLTNERCAASGGGYCQVKFNYGQNGQIHVVNDWVISAFESISQSKSSLKSYDFYDALKNKSADVDYHVYRILWKPDTSLIMYVDNLEIHRFKSSFEGYPLYASMSVFIEDCDKLDWPDDTDDLSIGMEIEYIVIQSNDIYIKELASAAIAAQEHMNASTIVTSPASDGLKIVLTNSSCGRKISSGSTFFSAVVYGFILFIL